MITPWKLVPWLALALLSACIDMAPFHAKPQPPEYQDLVRARSTDYADMVVRQGLTYRDDRVDGAARRAVRARMAAVAGTDILGLPLAYPGRPTGVRPALARRYHQVARGCQPTLVVLSGRRAYDCTVTWPRPADPLPGIRLASIAPAAGPLPKPKPLGRDAHQFQIHFDLNSTEIDRASARLLNRAVGRALLLRPARIEVAGHADRSGSAAYNRRLSIERARRVADLLAASGLPAERIATRFLGESDPMVATADGVVHSGNRRVVISFL